MFRSMCSAIMDSPGGEFNRYEIMGLAIWGKNCTATEKLREAKRIAEYNTRM